MPDKTTILEGLENRNYTVKEVQQLVLSVKESITAAQPTDIKKGDVYLDSIGLKRRPVVIISIQSDMVYGIPLSTTDNALVLCPCESRFYPNSFFTKSVACSTREFVSKSCCGLYDNDRHLNEVITLLMNELWTTL